MKRYFSLMVLILLSTGLQSQAHPFEAKVSGSGTPVLFLPGFTCTGEVWKETTEALSDRFECHVFTFAGFGDVPPISFPWLPELKKGVEAYISENDLKDAILVGHSMGGTLALWLASDGVEGISEIVVVDGLPASGALMIPDYDPDLLAYESPWNKQMLEMDSVAFEGMARQMAAGMSRKPEAQEQIIRWMKASDRETYVYGYTDLLKLDLREALSAIEVPVSVIAATEPFGESVARNTYETQFSALKGYELTFVPDASHFVMYDQPEIFMDILSGILNKEE